MGQWTGIVSRPRATQGRRRSWLFAPETTGVSSDSVSGSNLIREFPCLLKPRSVSVGTGRGLFRLLKMFVVFFLLFSFIPFLP